MPELFLRCEKIACLNGAYYFYRQNPNGIVQSKSITSIEDYLEIIQLRSEKLLQILPDLRTSIEEARDRGIFLVWLELKQSRENSPAKQSLRAMLLKEISKMKIGQVRHALDQMPFLFRVYAISLKLCPWSERLTDMLLFSGNASGFRFMRRILSMFHRLGL